MHFHCKTKNTCCIWIFSIFKKKIITFTKNLRTETDAIRKGFRSMSLRKWVKWLQSQHGLEHTKMEFNLFWDYGLLIPESHLSKENWRRQWNERRYKWSIVHFVRLLWCVISFIVGKVRKRGGGEIEKKRKNMQKNQFDWTPNLLRV